MNASRATTWTLAAVLSLAAILVASPGQALAKGDRSDKRPAGKVRRLAEAVAKARRKAIEARARAARREADAAAKTAARAQSAHGRRAHGRTRGEGRSISHRGRPRPPGRRGPHRRTLEEGRSISRRGRSRRPGGRIQVHILPRYRWVPGHYVTRVERVLVEPAHYEYRAQEIEVVAGRWEVRRVEQVTEILYDSRGDPHEVVVECGREEKVWIPPIYETRQVKVHVPDRYEMREVRLWVAGRWERVSQPTGLGGFSLGAVIRF